MKNVGYKMVLATGVLPLVILTGCATKNVTNSAQSPVNTMEHATKIAQPLPPPSAMESQVGIQIAHVGLTASGGLVDLRFKVLDAAKARALLGKPANAPMLIANDIPPLMPPHKALHGARYSQGQVVYILYPNLRGAIKPGVEVIVAMGDARLGPVTAQ